MPGRGNPWKEGGHIDDTILGEDIKDGTISEADLDSSLQTKVNAGGGGIDHFTQTELLDDFYYADPGGDAPNGFLDTIKYRAEPGTGSTIQLDQPQSGKLFGGVIYVEVNSTLSGQGSAFRSTEQGSGGGQFNSNKPTVMRIRSAIVNDLTLRIDGMGLIDDNFGIFGGTTFANFDSSVDEGFYFKKESGGNWIAVSQDSNANTDTDTGVSATVNVFQEFEVIHTPGVSDVFKIDGTTVVTHTTTIADTGVNLFLSHAIVNLGAGIDRGIEIDLWHVVADR